MDIKYQTKTGNAYPLELHYKQISKDEIVYSPQKMEDLCRNGCRNYGKSGGCPPLAPKLDDFPILGDRYILIVALFDSKHKPPKVRECNNRAIHWKFQDGILARFMDRLGRSLQEQYFGYFLGTGYCMGCSGKKCAIKLGESCRAPEKRTFSMEATGINVVSTVQNIFHKNFYWYTKKQSDIPYMMKCILYHTANENISDADMYLENLK